MTPSAAVAAAAGLTLTAIVVIWPRPGRRERLHRLLAAPDDESRGRRTVPRIAVHTRVAWYRWSRRVPGRLALPVGAAAIGALLLAGAVAAVVVAAYGALAARTAARHRAERARTRRRGDLLAALSGAAADLRAGLPVTHAFQDLSPRVDPPSRADLPPGTASGRVTMPDGAAAAMAGSDPLLPRILAATRLAERTGAPLADVIDRIEADARAADRARAMAAGQAAGSRATAWLLAGLPVGGIALGYVIGTDPLAVLLHTPPGAACAIGAVILQFAGLGWANRLIRADRGAW